MEIYTEASLNKAIESNLNKKGIKRTTDSIDELNGENVYIDLYNSLSSNNDNEIIEKLMETCKSIEGYSRKIIYLPVSKWYALSSAESKESNTPLGAICRFIKKSPSEFKDKFSDYIFIFYNNKNESFTLYPNEYISAQYATFRNLLITLATSNITRTINPSYSDERKSPVRNIRDTKKDRAYALEVKKQDLLNAISDATENSSSEEEVMEKLNNDEYIKSLIDELEQEDDGNPKFNNARTSRMTKLNNEFIDKKIRGESIGSIMSSNAQYTNNLPSTHLKINSINEEWDDMKFINFQKSYNISSDIVSMLYSLKDKSYPISIIDINVEDTSTKMDSVYTYTVHMEDGFGKRFSLTFDIPKFKNDRFMRLRGNEKVMSGQLLLLPCLKTDEDTVQCVSNYNKIFIYRHGLTGRSYPSSDRFIKTIRKTEDKSIKVYFGDNKAICSKYELPIDYIDLCSNINRIETKTKIYYFNQDEYYKDYNADITKGIPYSINRSDNSINYYNSFDSGLGLLSNKIAMELCSESEEFKDRYHSTKPANRLNYSQASIMSNRIPLIVVLGYSLGLDAVLEKCTSDYSFVDKRTKYNPDEYGIIKFSDMNLMYKLDYGSSMLLNGLSECNTEDYSIKDIGKRSMWLDFLDKFGGRILADGLDNFVDLFIDPITKEICEHCRIPSNYFDMLIYASNLLSDNKYNKHTDITGNRYRTNEIVAGYFYKALGKSYTDYKSQAKRGKAATMTMKRSAVIDLVMQDPMLSDLSIMNPLLEIEAANSASFKGLSGMNSDRSYSLDKRTYDDTMINKLALSTGFAANVGINRQTTIDMDIEGNRGYIKNDINNEDNMSVTKTFSMCEAVTPFGTTRDDPFRSAMTFIQTSKHSMPTKKSMPLLITNGADEAMPYISSDIFAYKAKADGKVIEIKDNEYMIIEYNDPIIYDDGKPYKRDHISLKSEIMKNSDGGFYVTIKLDTDLKVGSKFNRGDIIAYNRDTYSNKNGEDDNLAYNLGVLAKVAILNTDEGFEDSTSVSKWMSDAMTTDVVVEKDKDLSKNTNVYYIAKVGQPIQEGDSLLIFQNAFDELDANILLKNITDKEFVSDLGRVKVKSKYTGWVEDIKIYRTCEIDEMSDSLKKIVTDYEKSINKKNKLYKDNNIPGANELDPNYKMQATGIMKNNNDGVKIVFYIRYNDKLSVGDKTVAQSANKGTVKNIFPDGKEPFSSYRPEESIHALYAARSFNARMVTSVWSSGAINKAMIELDRQVKEIMGIDWKYLEDME